MLKFQTATKEELKLAATIRRKQQTDVERKQRIFNPRFRKIGIDKEFLDKQVEEKKQQHELERAQESELNDNLIRSSKIALLLEEQQKEEKRKIHKELERFRQQFQRADQRRDYDLNDPNALKKASIKDGEEAMSLGGFEDSRTTKERIRVKKEENRWWIKKQKDERAQAEREHQEAEKAYQEAVISRDKRAVALDQMERECRRRLNEATARFNRAMAEEREQRRHCEALREEEDKKADIYNHMTGDFLMEAKEQADSIHGPHKPLASRYKGMNAEQLRIFREQQADQKKEIERMRSEEKQMNEEWDRLMNSHAEIAGAYQYELERKRTEINKKVAEENLKLAQQHKSQQEHMKWMIYNNTPTEEYYEQFNRDAR